MISTTPVFKKFPIWCLVLICFLNGSHSTTRYVFKKNSALIYCHGTGKKVESGARTSYHFPSKLTEIRSQKTNYVFAIVFFLSLIFVLFVILAVLKGLGVQKVRELSAQTPHTAQARARRAGAWDRDDLVPRSHLCGGIC